jgi:HSP20 family protein
MLSRVGRTSQRAARVPARQQISKASAARFYQTQTETQQADARQEQTGGQQQADQQQSQSQQNRGVQNVHRQRHVRHRNRDRRDDFALSPILDFPALGVDDVFDARNMFKRLDRLFGNFALSPVGRPDSFLGTLDTPDPLQSLTQFTPKLDIQETDKATIVKVELPGMDKANIEVNVSDGVLEIKGEKSFEKQSDDKRFTRIERAYGTFVRRIPVPDDLDPSQVKAKFENGVLELTLPKPEEKKQPEGAVKIE